MSELRSYLIAEDDSLELKTLTNEGVVLIVDIKRKRKFPLLHFIGRIKGVNKKTKKRWNIAFLVYLRKIRKNNNNRYEDN